VGVRWEHEKHERLRSQSELGSMRVYASRRHDKKTGSSLRIAWYCLSGSSQPPHTGIARLCLRRSTRRSAETTPPFYHRACSYIPPWSLVWNATSGAPGAHAPNALPAPHPPLHTDGEILKHNMMMHISSGATLIDKVVSIDLLRRFRE